MKGKRAALSATPLRTVRGQAGAAALAALLALLAADLLADGLGRAAGWGALGANPNAGKRVALTFDDGPSERTPELLRVLAEAGARGTFFVTQPACQRYPEYLADIRRAGHQLESHGRWHRTALLLWPWQEWQQIAWQPHPTATAYRPPYGGHSPLTRLFARLLGRQVVLWDAESRDWLSEGSPQERARQTLEQVRPGSVVLLHDGPAITPELLRQLLPQLQAHGWQMVTLNQLPPARISLRSGLKRIPRSLGL